MIHLVVGHRGAGKTSFIERVKRYYEERMQACTVFDLDREIEKSEALSVSEIFAQKGEVYFRERESAVLNYLLQQVAHQPGAVYIALGAGFTGDLPDDVTILWVRRPTDHLGRIFLDRPRLDDDFTPLAEFMRRFDEREARFRKWAHKQIILGEGWMTENAYEPSLVNLRPANLQTSITLLPQHFASPKHFEMFAQDGLLWGVRYFELRDDILSEEQIRFAAQELPREKVLISFRQAPTSPTLLEFSHIYATDWAIELGDCPLPYVTIASLHARGEDEAIEEATERLLKVSAEHYKLAVPIENFIELWSGHRFFQDDPLKRSFLPGSREGRWAWYRLIQNKKMMLNFMRVDEGSSPDQPTVFDFLRYPDFAGSFAAVMGAPVLHSHTPAEQHEFFLKRQMGVVALPFHEEDCDSLNMSILQRLGLRAAAVTSPLKMKMKELCSHFDRAAFDAGAVNTLVATTTGWSGTNTDTDGMRSVFASLDMPEELVVWGGGGTRMALKNILPHAHFFSARRGQEIWVEKQKPVQPEVVVWALGRNRIEQTVQPPSEWRPQYVVDMNYTENSPGLEYAMKTGAKYISGRAIFKSQARAQRDFWAQANV